MSSFLFPFFLYTASTSVHGNSQKLRVLRKAKTCLKQRSIFITVSVTHLEFLRNQEFLENKILVVSIILLTFMIVSLHDNPHNRDTSR